MMSYILVLLLILASCEGSIMARKWSKVNISETSWHGLTEKEENFASSPLACGVSDLNSAYYYDPTTGQCQIGYPTCVLPTNDDHKEIFMPHLCSDNDCEISAKVLPNDKSSWSLKGSSHFESNYELDLIMDGDLTTTFISDQTDQYPWVEVILESSQIVKAVQLQATADNGINFSYLEIRVGENEVASSVTGHNKICSNRPCHRSGELNQNEVEVFEDCITPTRGRYISIQKYGWMDRESKNLKIGEVDVYLYCEMPKANERGICLAINDDEEEDCGRPFPETLSIETFTIEYLGCYRDCPIRIMEVKFKHPADNTPNRCSQRCFGHGPTFIYSGVEWGQQCFCGESGEHKAFSTVFGSDTFQIDLSASQTVYKIMLQGSDCCASYSLPHLEIRVGDQNVISDGRRICVNKICHRTGGSEAFRTEFSCTAPRSGQYVAIQRYRQLILDVGESSDGWQMVISEVDVTVKT